MLLPPLLLLLLLLVLPLPTPLVAAEKFPGGAERGWRGSREGRGSCREHGSGERDGKRGWPAMERDGAMARVGSWATAPSSKSMIAAKSSVSLPGRAPRAASVRRVAHRRLPPFVSVRAQPSACPPRPARVCARQALTKLGGIRCALPPRPLLPEPRRRRLPGIMRIYFFKDRMV